MSDPSSPAGASAPDDHPHADSPRFDRPALDAAVARYHRAERVVSWTLALLVAGVFLAAVAALSFWPGAAVGVALAVALRVPAVRRRGSTRHRTDAPPETVAREFASSRPPVLAFQWGVADEVRGPDDEGSSPGNESPATGDEATAPNDGDGDGRESGTTATYAFSYLFGLRTAEIALDVDVTDDGTVDDDRLSEGAPDPVDEPERPPVAAVEIEATVDGRPWASYAVAVREAADGGSVVDVELRPTRRFDLRRIPQGRLAERHYADALAAQGYEVVERTTSLTW